MTTWTDERIAALRRLWDEKKTVTDIGRLIGMPRGAVAAKARRLNLEARPKVGNFVRTRVMAGDVATAPQAAPPPKPPEPAPVIANGPPCKWPIGDPRQTNFHFCCEPSIQGRPYCPDHCAQAYSSWGRERAA